MYPYIIVFIVNLFLAFLADKTFYSNKVLCVFSLLGIVLIDTVFIGLRDFGVGIDTIVYIDDYFYQARNIHSLKSLFLSDGYDKGYLILAKFATYVSRYSQSLMVLTELFIISFTTLGIYNYKKIYKVNFVTFFLLYWLLYLCFSENLMRQYCALSLLFWGWAKYLQGEKVIYLIVQIVSYFFHTTSIIFLLIPVIHYISNQTQGLWKAFSIASYFFFIVSILILFSFILNALSSEGVIKEVYQDRYDIGSELAAHKGGSIGVRFLIDKSIVIIVLFQAWKRKVLKENELYIVTMLFCSMLMLEQLKYIVPLIFRIIHYLGVIEILYLSMILEKKHISLYLKFFYIGILCVSFYYDFMKISVNGWSFWYSSKILGI